VKGYLAAYPDVKAAGVNPLDHYDQAGWKEGRDPSTAFDTTDYLSHYPDVNAAHVNPLTHFLQFGIHEGPPGLQRRGVRVSQSAITLLVPAPITC